MIFFLKFPTKIINQVILNLNPLPVNFKIILMVCVFHWHVYIVYDKYQHRAKMARHNYFSHFIAKHGHNSRTLLKTIHSAICPPPNEPSDCSPDRCEKFLMHFSKVVEMRQQFDIGNKTTDANVGLPPSHTLS